MHDRPSNGWAAPSRPLAAFRAASAAPQADAATYAGSAMAGSDFINTLFRDAAAGTFREGYVFRAAPDLAGALGECRGGWWRCDLDAHDRLTWSAEVYAMFGFPPGREVDRHTAVARYAQASRNALAEVRNYALRRNVGFILDARLEPPADRPRWIRVLAVPQREAGRICRLHGIKRALPDPAPADSSWGEVAGR